MSCLDRRASLVQQPEYLVVEFAVAADTVATADGFRAFPIGESATRFDQNGQNCGDVPRAAHGINHQIGPASGHHQIAVAIAPRAAEEAGLFDSRVSSRAAASSERFDFAGDEHGIRKLITLGHACRRPARVIWLG